MYLLGGQVCCQALSFSSRGSYLGGGTHHWYDLSSSSASSDSSSSSVELTDGGGGAAVVVDGVGLIQGDYHAPSVIALLVGGRLLPRPARLLAGMLMMVLQIRWTR